MGGASGGGAEREMSHAEIRDANWPKLRSMLEQQMAAITSKLELVQVSPVHGAIAAKRPDSGSCTPCWNGRSQDMVVQASSHGDVRL